MRVLSFDPGAERCGWACLDHLTYLGSGILTCHRSSQQTFQEYRLRLTNLTRISVLALINQYDPDKIVNEVVPAVGGGNFINPQSYLANVVTTTIHTAAIELNVPVEQISARSVQSRIAIRGKGKKITKIQVRNGVISLLPEFRSYLMKVKPDETDAIAIGLVSQGYTVP